MKSIIFLFLFYITTPAFSCSCLNYPLSMCDAIPLFIDSVHFQGAGYSILRGVKIANHNYGMKLQINDVVVGTSVLDIINTYALPPEDMCSILTFSGVNLEIGQELVFIAVTSSNEYIIPGCGIFHALINADNEVVTNWGTTFTPYDEFKSELLACYTATSTAGTPEVSVANVALSPNPTAGFVQFSYPSFADAASLSFTLFDAAGRQVLHQAHIGTQADLSRLSQGIYYYQIHHNGQPLQSGKLARQ